mmetsp:Transcript_78521/g.177336  ORF Transcript_78521/g.177336 Transcript_78521/m.177336 type:complete len:147 (+) Transcript_78521:117-557(+)
MEWTAKFLDGLLSVNHKPHEHKNWMVGASCLLLGFPMPVALAHGDPVMSAWLLAVTVCSFMADFARIGTVWNVVDRWVAVAFTVHLFVLAFSCVPTLAVANMFVVAGLLALSQTSKTSEQWRWRHSFWHLAMMFDIAFFLHCIYTA